MNTLCLYAILYGAVRMVTGFSRPMALCMLLLMPIGAYAEPEELEYAYPDISVWTTERDQDGRLKNPLLTLAGAIFEQAEIPWHPQSYPAKRMFSNLRKGISKFSMLVRADSLLQDCCLISNTEVALLEIRIFHLNDKPVVTSIEELNGRSVITIQGYSYAGLLEYILDEENGIQNNPAPNHFAAFSMLKQGRADYVLDYAFPAAEVLAEEPMPGLSYASLRKTNVYLVLHKDYPDAENVMAQLEKIVAELDIRSYLNQP